MEYGISEYPDVKDLYRRIDKLMSQPAWTIKRDAMGDYLKYFDTRCSKSKSMIEEAKKFIPGGVQHNLAFNYPFPLVITKAEGAYLTDLDGNEYIDFLQAGGPTMLGSNDPVVKEKVIEIINECGPSTGLFHEYELKIAKLINKHMPGIEMFRLLGSGTEAVMAAIRLARVATGNKKIIKIGGAYHGWSDQMVYDLHIPGTYTFEAHGIPFIASWHTQGVRPNDIGALKRKLAMNRLRGGTAAVILEPLGPESGTRPVDKDYNKQVRELCDAYGALLIFDEVVTGFRVGLGGAQGYFNVKPDLTVFGKTMAGGYPAAGGLGGRADLIRYLAAGVEGGSKRAYVGGTMSANPLSAVAGYYAIERIAETNACVKAGEAGDKITKGLQDLIDDYDLPFIAYNTGSIAHLETVAPMYLEIKILKIKQILKEIKKRKHAMEEYGAAFMAEGIVTLAGSRLYTSLATTDEVIDKALEGFGNVFRNVEGADLD
ncbi:MAG: aminotransferase class III-fold pyridoxal phosphate-dependent enzyme [Candidatus Heimdallarchaeota archaeon]|nr:aminotransferase class III-fold pyridoxal phosphate-dependent enzyme [Candidatus Heimdallarchaeota archaeon]